MRILIGEFQTMTQWHRHNTRGSKLYALLFKLRYNTEGIKIN